MDKSKQIINTVRDRLGNKPYYNPVEFLEMCVVVRDELEAAEQRLQADGAVRICQCDTGYPIATHAVCGICGLPRS